MKHILTILALGASLALVGCKKEKTAEQTLQETFQAPAQPAATQPEAAPAGQPQSPPVDSLASQAAADIKAQNYSGAATRLDAVTATPGISAAQLNAANNAKVAMEQELMRRARAGDQQALKALQELANRPSHPTGAPR